MRLLLTMCGSRGDVEPVRLAAWVPALSAAREACDALVAHDGMPAGGWQ
jgi:hypothetical protein